MSITLPLKQPFKYHFNLSAQLSGGRGRIHKWKWRGETDCGGSGWEDPKVTWYLETWWHQSRRFNSNFWEVFFMNCMIISTRHSDQPGPADLLLPGRETAGLCGALCPQWEDGHIAHGPTTAHPATLGGHAQGSSLVSCSSARGWDICHTPCWKRKPYRNTAELVCYLFFHESEQLTYYQLQYMSCNVNFIIIQFI